MRVYSVLTSAAWARGKVSRVRGSRRVVRCMILMFDGRDWVNVRNGGGFGEVCDVYSRGVKRLMPRVLP